jgi:hypothetical protein
MKKIILFLALSIVLTVQAQQRPKLVVGIVVDQMKMEYLYRFSDDFSANGFKKGAFMAKPWSKIRSGPLPMG